MSDPGAVHSTKRVSSRSNQKIEKRRGYASRSFFEKRAKNAQKGGVRVEVMQK